MTSAPSFLVCAPKLNLGSPRRKWVNVWRRPHPPPPPTSEPKELGRGALEAAAPECARSASGKRQGRAGPAQPCSVVDRGAVRRATAGNCGQVAASPHVTVAESSGTRRVAADRRRWLRPRDRA